MEITLDKKETLIEEFIENKSLINTTYAKQEEIIQELLSLNEPLIVKNDNGTWTRITITDNLLKIEDGFYAQARVSRYSTKVDVLKNTPKELKPVAK